MTLTSVGIYLFCAFVAATVGAFIGMSKHRAGLGFFLGVVGWIITAVMEPSLNERWRRNEELARTMQATNLQGRPTAVAVTAAGWYPDPWQQAARRWWDGSTWTGHNDSGQSGVPSPRRLPNIRDGVR